MKDTLGEKIFYSINYFLLVLVGLLCVLPMLHIMSLSISDLHAVASGYVALWPVGFTLESFKALFEGTYIVRAFGNSMVITLVGVACSMLFTILAAYPLSRRYFIGRKYFTLAMVFTMIFSGGLIPTYLLIRSLGLMDSYGALWLPGLVSTFNMLVMRTFFEGIPEEMEEAGRIDGCGEWRMLVQIMLPLSLPVMATLTLFYGVSFWNAFMSVLMYINSTPKYNLTVLVQQMVQSQSLMQEMNNISPEEVQSLTPESVKAAGIIVMLAPMLVVYPFLQKYFVKGVMIGAIKG
jgi:putative aldouronate transport system permease protein